MSKVCCPACRAYVDKGTAIRYGLSHVCSRECMDQLVRKTLSHAQPLAPVVSSAAAGRRPLTGQGHGKDPSSELRRRIRKRDSDRCRWCGGTDRLSVHHIHYRSEGIDHSPHNLITLCEIHHKQVHSNKRLYQPALLELVWEQYVNGRFRMVPEVLRGLEKKATS